MAFGYIVLDRTAVLSYKLQNKIAKLCYAVRDPYQIIRNTSHSSYYIKQLNELKSVAFDLYPLPRSLKYCKSVDIIDTRYLNQNHTPWLIRFETHLILIFILRYGLINHFPLPSRY